MAEYASTQADLAKKLGVTRATIIEWARDDKFPKKTRNGYNVDRARAYAEKNQLGTFRVGRGGKSATVGGVTLVEAKIKDTLEHAENERIKKERQLVEQAKELDEVLDRDEVRRLYMQTIATSSAVQDALTDAVDRAMPDQAPSAAAWPEIRERIMELHRKSTRDMAAAMQELK